MGTQRHQNIHSNQQLLNEIPTGTNSPNIQQQILKQNPKQAGRTHLVCVHVFPSWATCAGSRVVATWPRVTDPALL